MTPDRELRVLRGIVISIAAAVAFTAGPMTAFGGLRGMALLFGRPSPAPMDPALSNNLRAICVVFAGFAILGAWSLYALEERKTAFRIVCGAIFVAGLARVTGWVVEGYPGIPAVGLMTVEMVIFPLLLVWHTRLLRLQAKRSS